MSDKKIQIGSFWVSTQAENFEAIRLSDFNLVADECNLQAEQLATLREELATYKLGHERLFGTLLNRTAPKLHCNVSNIRITVNADGCYTIDPESQSADEHVEFMKWAESLPMRAYTLEWLEDQQLFGSQKANIAWQAWKARSTLPR